MEKYVQYISVGFTYECLGPETYRVYFPDSADISGTILLID